ncbi:hypothetical protein DDE05_22315 [Streptomyces cavourensis]|nr:hypothetical protein DDE05_22315 [Streptomyces cavourensis]
MRTIDPTAPVVVSLATLIDAPADAVWALHTDIDGWPAWNTGIDRARLDGPLEEGTAFRWLTHGWTSPPRSSSWPPGGGSSGRGPSRGSPASMCGRSTRPTPGPSSTPRSPGAVSPSTRPSTTSPRP